MKHSNCTVWQVLHPHRHLTFKQKTTALTTPPVPPGRQRTRAPAQSNRRHLVSPLAERDARSPSRRDVPLPCRDRGPYRTPHHALDCPRHRRADYDPRRPCACACACTRHHPTASQRRCALALSDSRTLHRARARGGAARVRFV